MPRTPRPGKRAFYVELDEAMFAGLQVFAERSRRTLRAVAILAFEAFLAANGEPVPTPGKPAKRGRKKKDPTS